MHAAIGESNLYDKQSCKYAQGFGFIRGMRAEIEARAIEGNTKNGVWRHGSDVQCVNKSGPDQTNPIRAGHAIGASEA